MRVCLHVPIVKKPSTENLIFPGIEKYIKKMLFLVKKIKYHKNSHHNNKNIFSYDKANIFMNERMIKYPYNVVIIRFITKYILILSTNIYFSKLNTIQINFRNF